MRHERQIAREDIVVAAPLDQVETHGDRFAVRGAREAESAMSASRDGVVGSVGSEGMPEGGATAHVDEGRVDVRG